LVQLSEGPDGVTFPVRVQPRAAKNEIIGEHGGALRLRLTAPPVDGEANKLCQAVLADWLGVPRSRVTIVAGLKSRNKTVRVSGITVDDVEKSLAGCGVGPDRP